MILGTLQCKIFLQKLCGLMISLLVPGKENRRSTVNYSSVLKPLLETTISEVALRERWPGNNLL